VHILSSSVKRRLATVLLGAGCAQQGAPGPREQPPVSPPASMATRAAQSAPPRGPCAGRPRCTVAETRALDGLSRAALLRAEIDPPANATTDEEQCRRREYWLQRSSGNLLLASDCETQWGADSTGPAQVTLQGTKLSVQYVEFQADDRCETLNAVIDLQTVRIEHQERKAGAVASDRCNAQHVLSELPPLGDGSSERPLLVLHAD